MGETFSFTCSSVKEEVVFMKLKLLIILSALVLLLVACNSSGTSSGSEKQLESLKDNYPEVETKMEKLHEQFRSELTAPDMDRMPFDVEEVNVRAQTKVEPHDFELIYKNKDQQLSVIHRDEVGKRIHFEDQNVELEENVQGYYSGSKKMSKLSWISDNGRVKFELLSLVDPDGGEEAMTKEELIEVANSIIEQR